MTQSGQIATPVRAAVQKVFVASTSEVSETPWLRSALSRAVEAVKAKYPDVEFEPWKSAFEPGDLTPTRLMELATEVLGAVVVLSADDYVEVREERSAAPRDNLLLEAGLFLGRLGLANVLLLREKDSKWPSDLAGITVKEFTRTEPGERGNSEILIGEISLGLEEFIDRLMRSAGSVAARAIQHSSRRLMREAEELRMLLDSESSDGPLQDPQPANAYMYAVNQVEEQFITTTYLTSEFWTSREIETLAANTQMLQRVKQAEGKARRLILLNKPLEEELEDQRAQRRAARSREKDRVETMNREFGRLAKANLELMEQGFEVKVVFDRHEVWQQLPEQVEFEQGDTELALYDGKRLDIFTGFTSKKRSKVQSYFDGWFPQFPVLRHQVRQYFDQLWESDDAKDFSIFRDEMKTLIEEVNREIDYTSNWLVLYDMDSGHDGDLKKSESDFVVSRLESRYGPGEAMVQGHLDLGTCTGRYLKLLAPFVAGDGQSVGIDIDPDCIDLLNHKKARQELDQRTVVSRADIRKREQLPEGTFPLVTCMMGTLCHLQRLPATNGHYQDEWQTGLENVRDLLEQDGDAFIAVWDERACGSYGSGDDLLEIYGMHARTVLCQQTPLFGELKERIKQAGLDIVGRQNLEDRLRVLHLKHNQRSSAQ